MPTSCKFALSSGGYPNPHRMDYFGPSKRSRNHMTKLRLLLRMTSRQMKSRQSQIVARDRSKRVGILGPNKSADELGHACLGWVKAGSSARGIPGKDLMNGRCQAGLSHPSTSQFCRCCLLSSKWCMTVWLITWQVNPWFPQVRSQDQLWWRLQWMLSCTRPTIAFQKPCRQGWATIWYWFLMNFWCQNLI